MTYFAVLSFTRSRIRHIFRRFPFLLPLLIILTVTVVIYLLAISITSFKYLNNNYAASRIRDEEELRLAQALTRIYAWKQRGQFYPFQYGLPEEGRLPYTHLNFKPGLTFAILAPNRRLHDIDAYEPSYLTESLVQLLSAIDYDLSTYGRRFSFVNITMCPTTDDIASFAELREISPLLQKDSIKQRLKPMDTLSIACRTVLDVANCLTQSSTSLADSNYVILLEDDMMAKKQMLDQLWRILLYFTSSASSKLTDDIIEQNRRVLGLVQLHTPRSILRYTPHESDSLVELLSLSSLLTFILFFLCLRNWYKPFFCAYNILFISCTFLLCAFIINLVGRGNWLIYLHRAFHHQSVTISAYPSAPSTGASALLTAKQARAVGDFLNTFSCKELDVRQSVSKAHLIHHYMSTHNVPIWRTIPNLVEHRGLYSMYQMDVDPRVVE
ncbi:DNAj subfamily C member [Paragonimus kellicotti]|nr:DNAj subfamily C member [Paragonimus kellicotti]